MEVRKQFKNFALVLTMLFSAFFFQFTKGQSFCNVHFNLFPTSNGYFATIDTAFHNYGSNYTFTLTHYYGQYGYHNVQPTDTLWGNFTCPGTYNPALVIKVYNPNQQLVCSDSFSLDYIFQGGNQPPITVEDHVYVPGNYPSPVFYPVENDIDEVPGQLNSFIGNLQLNHGHFTQFSTSYPFAFQVIKDSANYCGNDTVYYTLNDCGWPQYSVNGMVVIHYSCGSADLGPTASDDQICLLYPQQNIADSAILNNDSDPEGDPIYIASFMDADPNDNFLVFMNQNGQIWTSGNGGPYYYLVCENDQDPICDTGFVNFSYTPANFTSTTNLLSVGLTVTSPVPGATYFWDFGNGQTQTTTASSITYTYSQSGTYVVCLTIDNPAGCDGNSCSSIFVNNTGPCANVTNITSCNQSIVASIGAGNGIWNVTNCGFQTPGMERIYSFTPSVSGMYTLNVAGGATGVWVDYFYKTASQGCNATGWTCIDDISTGGTVNFGPLTAGVQYYLLLDRETTTNTSTQTFYLSCPAVSCSQLQGTVTVQSNNNGVVTFQGAASGGNNNSYNVQWSFPGASPSSAQGPNAFTQTVTYSQNGTYTALLIVGDTIAGSQTYCTDSTPITVTVQIGPNSSPVAQNDNYCVFNQSTSFIDVLTNDSDPQNQILNVLQIQQFPTQGNATWNSNFIYYVLSNPTFVGFDSLSYVVCDNGQPSMCDTAWVYISINNCGNPCSQIQGAFTYTNLTNGTTQFVGTASGGDGSYYYQWVFSNATPNTTSGPNLSSPVVSFLQPGSQMVTMYVSDTINGVWCTDTVSMIVNAPSGQNLPPVAVNDSWCRNYVTGQWASIFSVLDNDYDPNQNSYNIASTGQSPAHGTLFFTPGMTQINYVWNDSNYVGNDSFSYVICDNGIPSLCDTAWVFLTLGNCNDCNQLVSTFTYNDAGNGVAVFTGTASGGNGTYLVQWDFPGGNPPSAQGINAFVQTVQYQQSGSYPVTLMVFDTINGNFCGDTLSMNIIININTANPCANILSLPCNQTVNASFGNTGSWNFAGTNNNNSCGWATPGEEIIYSFTPTTSGFHSLNLQTVSGNDYVDIFIKQASSGCSNTGWTCIGDFISASNAPLGNLTAGVTYYLLFDREVFVSSSPSTITKSIRINCPFSGQGDTLCGYVFYDNNGNGVQDNNETLVPQGIVYIDGVPVTYSNGYYSSVVAPGIHTVDISPSTPYVQTLPLNQSGYVITGSMCNLNFGIQNNNSYINGLVYIDNNGDCIYNTGDQPLSNQHVTISNGTSTYQVYTTNTGTFSRLVGIGTWTVSYTPSPTMGVYTSTPASYTVQVTSGGQSYGNNNFCLTNMATPGNNLCIVVTTNTTVTPGFPAWYHIWVYNIGTVTCNAAVDFYYDANVLNYTNSYPQGSGLNPSAGIVSFTLNNLAPGATSHFTANFQTDSFGLVIGQNVFTMASVYPTSGGADIDFSCNVDTIHQQVTASWDPNNKTNLPMGYEEDGRILGSEPMVYSLNFQNTGNAPAVNVVLIDTLESDLDLSSLDFIGSSHPCTFTLEGNVLRVIFSGIMLPDSNTNERESHGFATFRISLNDNLVEGTTILNNTDIYFDLNEPVRTNTVLNTIDYSINVNELDETIQIVAAPNPFNIYTQVKIEGYEEALEALLTDISGRQVNKYQFMGNEVLRIQRDQLSAGVYFLNLNGKGKTLGRIKLIVE